MDRRNLLISVLLVIIGLIGILPAVGFAQVEEEWVRRYDGANREDKAVGVGVDGAGNVYVVGSSQNSNGLDQIVILKYNANGNVEWSRQYGLPENSNTAYAMTVDNAGNIYVTGTFQTSTKDIVTIKYDTNGNRLWAKHYAATADPGISLEPDDTPASIAVDRNGNVCVVGHSIPGDDSYTEFVTLKYDAAGNELWAAKQRFDYGAATDIAIDVSGNVYLGGYARLTRGFNQDYLAIKYDSAGRLRWWTNFDVDGGGDFAYAIAVDAAANVYLAGDVTFFDEADDGFEINSTFGTVKIDSTGQPLWLIGEGTNFSDAGESARDVAVDAQGNIYVTGFAEWSPGNIDFLTVKYDIEGNQAWIRNYTGPGSFLDAASKLVIDYAGNVYVTGFSTRFINGFYQDDYTTVKYDNAGNERWVMRYNGPGNTDDHPSGLAVDANGNVYVTGFDTGTVTGQDFATIKYSQTALSAPVSFRPTDDAYVEAAHPTSNFGTRLTLRVREASTNAEQSYLKFNVSGLTGQVQSAKLRLYVTDASTDGGNLYTVSNNYQGTATPWTQRGLNWNNAPSIAGAALKVLGPVGLNTWVEIDVTSAITGNGVYSYGIKNTKSDFVYYSSKEGSNPPELLIRTISAVPPAPIINSFLPTSASPSTEVTIYGANFTGATAVKFNETLATTFAVDTDGQIRANVPVGATTGKISVTTPGGTGISLTDFTVTSVTKTFTFYPASDAYVQASNPTANFGTRTYLRQRQSGSENLNTYLKFNVIGLSGVVQSAKLRLFVTDASTSGGSVYAVSNNYQGTSTPWTQSGLNWNNAPAISGTALSSAGPVTLGTWVEFDVTAEIASNGVFSFAMNNGASDLADYSAKEGVNKPELMIQTSGSSLASIAADLAAEEESLPEQFSLSPNYPNPFNAGTTIAYALPQEGNVRLVIYNMLGQTVRKLIDENQTAGYKRILWDGVDERGIRVGSGMYFYRIEFGQQRLIGKMILQQ